MIPLEEAQRFVVGLCRPLPPTELRLDDALGCVLETTVVATEEVPPFANSSMDGYAVRADDTSGAPVRLTVIGSIMAGHPLEQTVGPGQAARIMTGAPVPPGADAVCMVEEVETARDGRSVVIGRQVQRGDFVRHPGRDVAIGDIVAPAGTVLTPAHLGVLADQGAMSVRVHPRLRVGVLSTGDELFSGSGPLPPGKIRNSNRHTLLALVRREGWNGVDLGTVGDDESALVERLSSAGSNCDAILTSGGVSVGDLDLVRVVLESLSPGTMRWMQVAIRPAKPFAFGVLAESATPVFGLPGNPVSAMVSFELFARPALRLLGGHRVLHRPVISATADVDLHRKPDGKLHLLRARLTLENQASWRACPTDGQESHQLHSMSEANSLILLPDGAGVKAGEQVSVLLIDPDRLTPIRRRAQRYAGSTGGRVTIPVPVTISVKARRARPDSEVAPALAMPLEGPLVDRYGRVHDDLRISVTDRCNLRCVYCMPEEGLSFLPRGELLTFDEITRLAHVARGLGVSALRITGGEPLVRKGLPSLIGRLSAVGFEDLAMTTNGTELAGVAGELVAAGLRRVNVSCDSLRPERFAAIRRRGELDVVLNAMSAAEKAGLTPLKVNVVLLRGHNDDEILDFASFARTTGRIVRFIEFMPLDAQGEWDRNQLVTGREVFERISAVWPLEPLSEPSGAAPAERFCFADGIGEIGLISSVSEPFCGTCNRLRVTADGALRNCLFSDDEQTVRDLLRNGGTDADLSLLFRQAVWAKFPGHGINEPGFLSPARSMSMIGG